jgi:prepilin-type N-terminal cleavage/methylation domain-containing protein/prepilin-type processing-associated H-X9-DG protein
MLRKKAFTLVELLVVMGVISVLVAMLMPALRKAREASQKVQCLSNLKQCYLGIQMYQNANRGYIPQYRWKGGVKLWGHFVLAGMNANDEPNNPKYMDIKASICPSNPFRDEIIKDFPNVSDQTYGLYMHNNSDNPFCFFHFYNGNSIYTSTHYLMVLRPDRLKALGWVPARSMMLVDTSMGTSGWEGRPVGQWMPTGGAHHNGTIQTLHGERANVMFFDGHGESLMDKEMRFDTDTKPKYFRRGAWSFGYTIP